VNFSYFLQVFTVPLCLCRFDVPLSLQLRLFNWVWVYVKSKVKSAGKWLRNNPKNFSWNILFKTWFNIYNISYLNSPLHHSYLCPFPHSWNSFNRSHFSIYTHVYTVFAPRSPSYTLSPPSTPSHWYQSPRQDLFCPPVLCFVKEKNFFGLFRIATQGVSLWHLCMCMYYNLNWFISSIFLLSNLVSL
jgi:hypothetical protein